LNAAEVQPLVMEMGSQKPEARSQKSEVSSLDGIRLLTDEVAKGLVLAPPTSEEGQAVWVRLRGRGGAKAVAKFKRPVGETFGLLTQTGRGLKIDPALWRVFALSAAARPNDPPPTMAERKVLLVNDPEFDVERMAEGGDQTLVVATGKTRLPGVVLDGERVGGKVERVNGGRLPVFVRMDRVKVLEMQDATLSKEWEVLAEVDGKAWLAMRKFQTGGGTDKGGGVTVVWLGSEPSQDWAMDSSFPVFFADLLAKTFPVDGGGGGIQEWGKEEIKEMGENGGASSGGRVVGFSRWLGGMAILLLLGGSSLLLRRAR